MTTPIKQAKLTIDPPKGRQNRLTILLRPLLAIPVLLLLALISHPQSFSFFSEAVTPDTMMGSHTIVDKHPGAPNALLAVNHHSAAGDQAIAVSDNHKIVMTHSTAYNFTLAEIMGLFVLILFSFSTGFIFLPTLLMLLFRRHYPSWWFEWNQELLRFVTRISAYVLFLSDQYPSTTEAQSVHLDLPKPQDLGCLCRWKPLVKWLLALPHWIMLLIYNLLIVVIYPFLWVWMILVARYPTFLFNFVTGVLRYEARVLAYAILLTTDQYPSFRLRD